MDTNKKDAINLRLAQALYNELSSIDADYDQLRQQMNDMLEDKRRLLKNARDGDWECMQEELGISDEEIEEAYEHPCSRGEWDDMWLEYCQP